MSHHVDHRTRRWIGRTVIDRAGECIGTVEDIYTDDVGGHPAWIAVATGRFGLSIVFLPFAAASPAPGDELRVLFPSSLIKGAPVAGKGGRLTQDEVVRLYDHYGFDLEAEEVRERALHRRSSGLRGDYKPASPYVPVPAGEPPAPRFRPAAPAQAPPAPAFVPAQEAPAPALALPAPATSPPAVAPPAPAVNPAPAENAPAPAVRAAAAEKPAAAVELVAAASETLSAPAKKPSGRPTSSRFPSIVDLTKEPGFRPDSPLFWNHDDRIDSIRPPREPAPSGHR